MALNNRLLGRLTARMWILLGIAVLFMGGLFIVMGQRTAKSGSTEGEIRSKIKVLTAYNKTARSYDDIMGAYNKLTHQQTMGPGTEAGFSFEKIGDMARECSVTVISVKPRLSDKDKGKSVEQAGHILYDVTVRGNGAGILRFLDKVENQEFFARVKHLKVSAESRNADGLLQCVLFVDQLSVT